MYGKTYLGVQRSTFIIDGDGTVVHVIEKASPKTHDDEVLGVLALPELPEMEIIARRLDAALPGERIESAIAPGINALKTFDPPLSASRRRRSPESAGAGSSAARRRPPSHGPLTLLLHLMSAGRPQLFDKRAR